MTLKNRDKLLCDIVQQLPQHDRSRVMHIRVRFFEGDTIVKEWYCLTGALDSIANDVYWDENSDWRNADRAVVDTY